MDRPVELNECKRLLVGVKRKRKSKSAGNGQVSDSEESKSDSLLRVRLLPSEFVNKKIRDFSKNDEKSFEKSVEDEKFIKNDEKGIDHDGEEENDGLCLLAGTRLTFERRPNKRVRRKEKTKEDAAVGQPEGPKRAKYSEEEVCFFSIFDVPTQKLSIKTISRIILTIVILNVRHFKAKYEV